jgi:hypothetical protein
MASRPPSGLCKPRYFVATGQGVNHNTDLSAGVLVIKLASNTGEREDNQIISPFPAGGGSGNRREKTKN